MKKLTLFFLPLLCLFINDFAYSQTWEEEHPFPTTSNMNDIYFASSNRGWVVGQQGLIMVSDNRGDKWFIQESGVNENLNAVWFVDEQEGWVVGNSGLILHTTDAGNNWQAQTTGTNSANFKDVQFIDNQTGWAISYQDSIFITTDGGQNWQPQYIGNTAILKDLKFIDNNRGWILSDTTVWRTTDGGQNWTQLPVGAFLPLNGLDFTDNNHGWIAGYSGITYRTIDGGNSWIADTLVMANGYELRDMYFMDSLTGVTMRDNIVFKTIDGGQTWNFLTGGVYQKFFFADTVNMWALTKGFASHSLSRSDNGGQNINTLFHVNLDEFVDIHAIDSNNIWATGYSGEYLSSDGGKNWESKSSLFNTPTYEVEFDKSGQYGWMTSSWLRVARTTDGGQNWVLSNSLGFPIVTDHLTKLTFVDSMNGWVGTTYGDIIRTTNGGQNWQASATGFFQTRMLQFKDPLNGWMSDFANNYKTTDGGQNWVNEPDFLAKTIHDLQFLNASEAWAVGQQFSGGNYEGLIFKTIDGGDSWAVDTIAQISSLSKVKFVTNQTGWVVDGTGEIWKTTDGGQNWIQENKGVESAIKAIDAVSDHHCWAVGELSAIIRYQDCSINSPVIIDNSGVLSVGTYGTYQWFLNGSTIPGATQQNYTPTTNGVYTVIVGNNDICIKETGPFVFDGILSSVGASIPSTSNNFEMTVYPNPNQGQFTLRFSGDVLPENIQVFSLDGKLIQELHVSSMQASVEFSLPQGSANGVYFVTAQNNAMVTTKKIVVLR